MICSMCTQDSQQARDGLCHRCRLRAAAARAKRYHWTPEMDAQLRRLYRTARNKAALTAGITATATRHRWPRYVVINRAQSLELRIREQRLWTAEEVETLQELAGELPVRRIAARLRRTQAAITNKLFTLGCSRKIVEGYSQNELAQLMGVHHNKVGQWVARGFLTLSDVDRVTHTSVVRFLRRHMDEYHFRSCEEWWLRTMLRPAPRVKPRYGHDKEAA